MHRERKHIRLRNFDYSSVGQYFITICTKDRKWFFGNIENNKMVLSEIGNNVNQYFLEIENHFSNVTLDEYVIMPNHVHCILELNNNVVGASHVMPQNQIQQNKFSQPIPGSISVIIQQFKSSVKRWCNKTNHEYFNWQSRFHDHVIRNADEYHRIKQYIINNPSNWKEDNFF